MIILKIIIYNYPKFLYEPLKKKLRIHEPLKKINVKIIVKIL